jgi:hypothetical protein
MTGGGLLARVHTDHGTNSLFVVDTSHVAKALLAGNIPELKTHLGLLVPSDDLERKVDTNGRLVVHGKDVVNESLDDAAFLLLTQCRYFAFVFGGDFFVLLKSIIFKPRFSSANVAHHKHFVEILLNCVFAVCL